MLMLQYCPQSIAGGAVNVTAQRPQYRVLGHMARAKPEHPYHSTEVFFFQSEENRKKYSTVRSGSLDYDGRDFDGDLHVGRENMSIATPNLL